MLVSSHLLAEVEQMCSHVGVMYEGKLVAQGRMGELRRRGGADRAGATPTGRTTPARVLTELGLTEVA